ncbi:MAG: glycosyltransferase family 4 protein [Chloroflexi bacterium]|nr:glycosyltransferase family 4 protein [Chloroflexota bacterium]
MLTRALYFVTRHYGQAQGGLGLYEESLLPWLQRKGNIRQIEIKPLSIPRRLVSIAALMGTDLAAVAQNYPCRLDPVPEDAIVHLSNQNLALASLANRLPASIITVHDVIPYIHLPGHQPLSVAGGPVERLLIRINAIGIRRATRVVADSQCTKNDLIRSLHIASNKIDVIPLGLDHNLFRPMKVPREFCRRYGLRGDEQYILYVGSQEPRKNLRTLCAAVGKVVTTVPQARLLLVGRQGTPEQESSLARWIQEAGLAKRTRRIPFVPLPDLPLMYNISTVLAFPSWYEGFGMPPLEAMACGCPVVASNTSSIPEVVGDGGILVDPREVDAFAAALSRVLTDKNLRQELRTRGIARAKLFTWERTADETIKVYRKVMEQG